MACCKCCCGNKDCAEGEIGKCCCGGSSGSCCTASQYCCDGACQSTPCTGACCDATFGCTQAADEATCTGDGGTWIGLGIPCDPDPCGCQSNEDCGCYEPGATYYEELEALFPGLGCCPPGTVYESSLSACSSDGTALGVTAADENLCCCGGECVTCPTICVYQTVDDCENEIWNWETNISQAECETFYSGTWQRGTEPVNIPSYTYDTSYACDNPQTQAAQTIDPCTGVAALSLMVKKKVPDGTLPAAGPGTELKKLLSKIGITSSPTCSCNKRAKTMDEKGIAWCEENVETICDWLQEEATKRKLPFVRLAGKALIHLAIRRAKKGNNK